MTRAEFITDLKLRSRAISGMNSDEIGEIVDSALAEYSEYNPLKIISLDNPINTTGIYAYPSDADSVVGVLDSASKIPISFTIYTDASDNMKKLRLGRKELPSWENLVEQPYYESSSLSSSPLISENYEKFDIEYLKVQTIETVSKRGLNAVKLYAEYLGYESKMSNTGSFSDITDRDTSGASSTVKRSSKSSSYEKLSDRKYKQFRKKVISPYGERDKTYDSELRVGPYTSIIQGSG